MKKCNSEIMKNLKEVQSEIEEVVKNIENYSIITYFEGEEVYKDFDFQETINKYNELLAEERKLKGILALSNATTKLIGYDEDITISEGLVKLAQLSKKYTLLSRLKTVERKTKKIVSGYGDNPDRVKITECMYDIQKIPYMLKELKNEISKLQVAIDRTNLTNMIEY